jgi:glycine/D-amino acid oxidase-like deaminating enzyme/nitrite reductase/ring-hydroxylating ferredoxin subunit
LSVAALRFNNQAMFNPVKYIEGLIGAMDNYSYINKRVTRFEQKGKRCIIYANGNRYYADYIIITTHIPINEKIIYSPRLIPKRHYAICATLRRGKYPEGMHITLEEPRFSYRTVRAKEGNMIMAVGYSHRTGEHEGDSYEMLEKHLRERFNISKVKYAWSSQDVTTVDGFPMIGQYGPDTDRIFTATGYGAWGITQGTVAGFLLSDMVRGIESKWQKAYSPKRFPLESLLPSIRNVASSAVDVIRNIVPENGDESNGRIRMIRGRRMASYTDSNGKEHHMSASCSHMGCAVKWNSLEQTWDCSCHGSRFDKHGKVLRGPATKDLRRD